MNRRQLLSTGVALPALGARLSAAAAQQKTLKITGLETDVLQRPPGTPTYDAIHKLGVDNGSVVLRLRTDAGITGWASSSFGMIAGRAARRADDPRAGDQAGADRQGPGVSRAASAPTFGRRWSITVSAVSRSSQLRRPISRSGTFSASTRGCRSTRCSAPTAIACRSTRCAGGITIRDEDLSKFRRSIATALEQGYRRGEDQGRAVYHRGRRAPYSRRARYGGERPAHHGGRQPGFQSQ